MADKRETITLYGGYECEHDSGPFEYFDNQRAEGDTVALTFDLEGGKVVCASAKMYPLADEDKEAAE